MPTRVAGTTNHKRKHEPDFPIVQILEAKPGRVVTKEQLESLGIIAPTERVTSQPSFTQKVPT
jgi:hypothetical protein